LTSLIFSFLAQNCSSKINFLDQKIHPHFLIFKPCFLTSLFFSFLAQICSPKINFLDKKTPTYSKFEMICGATAPGLLVSPAAAGSSRPRHSSGSARPHPPRHHHHYRAKEEKVR
jgi:hypothetical protein